MINKGVLITGGSRGIGRELCITFARNGYNVITTYHNSQDKIDSLKEELSGFDVHFTAYRTDNSKFENAKSLLDQILKDYPEYTIDVLINNASVSIVGLAQDLEKDSWERLWNTNVTSVISMCKECIPLMLKQGYGKIINISSVWGNIGASCETAYSATKGAVNSYTKALARELAPSNIQVNAIAPGIIDTDMNSHLSKAELSEIADEIPAGRIGKTKDVANLALMLATSSDYLTGQIITVDGGWC